MVRIQSSSDNKTQAKSAECLFGSVCFKKNKRQAAAQRRLATSVWQWKTKRKSEKKEEKQRKKHKENKPNWAA